ncbi:MAG TPA: NRDE family protein [Streptosporangiaceae bacterium]
MCTAFLSIEGGTLLLAGVRDELAGRAWQPPARHWPEHPGLTGGLDLLAGGTWLAVAPAARRVACVLNGRGVAAQPLSRRSRGVLCLQAAAEGKPDRAALAEFDPFHLVMGEAGTVTVWSWDGDSLAERELSAGLHMMVNSGLRSQRPAAGPAELAAASRAADPQRRPQGGLRPAVPRIADSAPELPRVEYFLPRLAATPRPRPRPGDPVAAAWGGWLPLLDGDGIRPDDPRALLVRRELADGRVWGTTSVSAVAIGPDGLRYDFNPEPGNPAGWYEVRLDDAA